MKLTALSLLIALLIPVHALADHRFVPNWSLHENQPDVPNGGRTNAVAIHPTNRDLMFAASDSGGLFRRDNAGLRWQHVDVEGMPIFTQSVAFVPAMPNVVLVSAKANFNPALGGGGVWRSTDGGSTWNRVPLTVPGFSGWLDAYEISAAGQTVAVATSKGVFVSINGGSSFIFSNPFQGAVSEVVYSVLVTPGAQQRVYAGGPSGVRFRPAPFGPWSGPGFAPAVSIGNTRAFAYSPLAPYEHAFVVSRFRLYRTQNGGDTWTEIPAPPPNGDCGGAPFIKAALRSTSGGGDFLDLYHGNTCGLHRQAVPVTQPLNFSGSWVPLVIDHDGPRDLALVGAEPVLLATAGGLHTTADLGQNWTFAGGGAGGYNALQLTEVTGQYVSDPEIPRRGPALDLYFGTQDNNVWAIHPDGTALGSHPSEGFFIEAERKVPSPAASRITFTACQSCLPLKAERHLANALPVNHSGFHWATPVILRPGRYIQNVPSGLHFTADPDMFVWQPFADFDVEPVGIPKVAHATAGGDAVVYQPYGNFMSAQLLRIERFGGNVNVRRPFHNQMAVTPVPRSPVASRMVYAVDSLDWRHLIAIDTRNDQMTYTTDGGDFWAPHVSLTDVVTRNGSLPLLLFRPEVSSENLPLVTAISFHPTDPSQVLIGTREGGIYYSANRGASFAPLTGSEDASYVTSFWWASRNIVYVSTFGRGLWRLENKPIALPDLFADFCSSCQVVSQDPSAPDRPPFDASILVFDGSILGVRRSEKGQLREVFITRGSSYVFTGDPKDLQEDIIVTESDGKETFEPLPEPPKDGWLATGIVFLSDDTITGTAFAKSEMTLPPER